EHGFGILYNIGGKDGYQAFYEDGTLLPANMDSERDNVVCWLRDYNPDERFYYQSLKKKPTEKPLPADTTFSFFPCEDGGVKAEIDGGKEHFTIQVPKKVYRYYKESMCTCGVPRCVHTTAAAQEAQRRLAKLMHAYIVTDLPVNKLLFLEPDLENAVLTLKCKILDQELIGKITKIIHLLDAAHSDDYYYNFHYFLLDLYPAYDEYDSKFLEDNYDYMLLCLFEDPGYRKAVLDEGNYAEKEEYEDRQYRSNRACFKRVLKEYKAVVRELDDREDYTQDTYKECLLKYRGDLPGLLRYYAEGKEELDLYDIPFLEKIADSPDIDPVYISAVSEKIDQFTQWKEAEPVFHRLMARLSSGQRIETYGKLKNFTMPMEDIHTLDLEDQRKMINNMPLSLENFRYVMDTLLADAGPAEKGQYLLRTAERIRFSGKKDLKNAILESAAALPDSRLLAGFIGILLLTDRLTGIKEGSPEKEIRTYFTCSYRIVNNSSTFHTEFLVVDMNSNMEVLSLKEANGKLSDVWSRVKDVKYPPDLIRRLCLGEKEEEYRKELEKNQDAVDAFLFERNHKKFVTAYRKLCESLMDEKLLFTETAKAGIDWLIYRENDSNALAFKVGNARRYVVKDAWEFINAFRTGQTTEYGKDLILTHDTENLNEEDSAAIKILMNAKFTKGRVSEKSSKRYITVNDSLLGNLVEILSGRNVLFNDVPCTLRLESCKVRLSIDGRYVLSTSLDHKTQSFLNLAGKGFVLTKEENGAAAFLDRVDGTTEEIGLIDLVDRNPSVSVKPILKDFRKNIYSRYFEMFDVEKGVEHDFTLSRIRLNTYFDFEKSVITARTVMLKEDREVSAADLKDRIDQVRCEMLENYLQALGFENGILSDESHILSFFKLDFSRLRSLTNVYLSESLQNKELKSIGKPVIRVAYHNNLVNVFM
ncbi:MAG: SNF2 helicase associated domain-containing protein, partial [Blautia sp.]|nr:SNF2 helicase associated domain-containing protein [Blautia sp.]